MTRPIFDKPLVKDWWFGAVLVLSGMTALAITQTSDNQFGLLWFDIAVGVLVNIAVFLTVALVCRVLWRKVLHRNYTPKHAADSPWQPGQEWGAQQ